MKEKEIISLKTKQKILLKEILTLEKRHEFLINSKKKLESRIFDNSFKLERKIELNEKILNKLK